MLAVRFQLSGPASVTSHTAPRPSGMTWLSNDVHA